MMLRQLLLLLVAVNIPTCWSVCDRGLHGCGGHGDSAGPAGNPRGRLRSVRGIRGIRLLTAHGHRGAGARREVIIIIIIIFVYCRLTHATEQKILPQQAEISGIIVA